MTLLSQDFEELRNDAARLADQLPRSASKDEALEIAIKAAETSMRALNLVQDPNEKTMLSMKAQVLLDEA